MNTAVAKAERDKYVQMRAVECYNETSPGARFVPLFERVMQPKPHSQILDIGAAFGAASRLLKDAGHDVEAFDIAGDVWEHPDIPMHIGCLWHGLPVGPYDIGFCADVLEHIPTQFVALSVANMLRSCERLFLSISFSPDGHGDIIGKPLHLTVQNFVWWRDTLREIGKVHDARDLIHDGVFHVGN